MFPGFCGSEERFDTAAITEMSTHFITLSYYARDKIRFALGWINIGKNYYRVHQFYVIDTRNAHLSLYQSITQYAKENSVIARVGQYW